MTLDIHDDSSRPLETPAVRGQTVRDGGSEDLPINRIVSTGARPAWTRVLTARRAWIGACALAVLVRLFVMTRFTGTNDVHYWQEYATSISKIGLRETYRTVLAFNHPPLMALWVWFAGKVGGASGRWFPFVFKLLPLAGDIFGAALLARYAGRDLPRDAGPDAPRDARRDPATVERGLKLACLFLWNPVTLLVTAYHGNTDPLLASLCLWAALLAEEGNLTGAGFALGCAFNVKILAMVLLVPLAAAARTTRGLFRFAGAFAIMCLPLIATVAYVGHVFVERVFQYNSVPHPWGLSLFFDDMQAIRIIGPHFASVKALFLPDARYFIMGLPVLLTLVMRLRGGRRWLEAAAFGLCTSLVLAPGFGYQYLAWPLPLLFAIDPRRALKTSLAGGALLGLLYFNFWDGQYPGISWMLEWPRIGIVLGAVTWLSLASWTLRLGRSMVSAPRRSSSEKLRAQRAQAA